VQQSLSVPLEITEQSVTLTTAARAPVLDLSLALFARAESVPPIPPIRAPYVKPSQVTIPTLLDQERSRLSSPHRVTLPFTPSQKPKSPVASVLDDPSLFEEESKPAKSESVAEPPLVIPIDFARTEDLSAPEPARPVFEPAATDEATFGVDTLPSVARPPTATDEVFASIALPEMESLQPPENPVPPPGDAPAVEPSGVPLTVLPSVVEEEVEITEQPPALPAVVVEPPQPEPEKGGAGGDGAVAGLASDFDQGLVRVEEEEEEEIAKQPPALPAVVMEPPQPEPEKGGVGGDGADAGLASDFDQDLAAVEGKLVGNAPPATDEGKDEETHGIHAEAHDEVKPTQKLAPSDIEGSDSDDSPDVF
jgi:hypothetical protein